MEKISQQCYQYCMLLSKEVQVCRWSLLKEKLLCCSFIFYIQYVLVHFQLWWIITRWAEPDFILNMIFLVLGKFKCGASLRRCGVAQWWVCRSSVVSAWRRCSRSTVRISAGTLGGNPHRATAIRRTGEVLPSILRSHNTTKRIPPPEKNILRKTTKNMLLCENILLYIIPVKSQFRRDISYLFN